MHIFYNPTVESAEWESCSFSTSTVLLSVGFSGVHIFAYNVLFGPNFGFFSSRHDNECPANGGPPYMELSSANKPGTCKREKKRG